MIRLKCLMLLSVHTDRPTFTSHFLRVMEKKAALTLEEEIADLNDKIRGYETKLEKAEADNRSDREERYTALINKARGTLDNLVEAAAMKYRSLAVCLCHLSSVPIKIMSHS
jgi:t-SNARE complex subunit (syntaxin)